MADADLGHDGEGCDAASGIRGGDDRSSTSSSGGAPGCRGSASPSRYGGARSRRAVWSSLPCYHPPASRASLLDVVGLGKHEAHCGGSEAVRLEAVRQGCGRPARGETGSCGRSLATEELPPFLLAGTWSSLSSPHLRAHAPVEGGSMADQRATCARAPAPHSMEACPATGEPSTSAPPPPAAMGPQFEARWPRHLGRPTS
jgi:hypothetical protein